jgi:pimeloyl-ACP methyl ester carboxylesterase
MERTVETRGIRIATESFGRPEDPAVVLVMGATASMLGWPEGLCHALAAQGFHVIRYDHRDTGLSTCWPPGAADYAVEDIAEDLRGVLDALALPRAHLVGMSLGGYIAQMAASRWPDRVAGLTLIGSEPLGWDGPPLPGIAPAFLDHFGAMADLDWGDPAAVEEFLVGIERLCAGTGAAFDEAAARARVRAVMVRSDRLASAFNHGALGLREDWAGAFRRIDLPVLVIHGAEDPILPLPNGAALAEGIPGARLLVLEGVGHELPERALGEIAAAIAAQAQGRG